MVNGKLFKSSGINREMKKGSEKSSKLKIEKIKQERDSWKETALLTGDPEIMRSIDKSLKQISSGQAIPLARL